MAKKVLLVGHCGPDSGYLRMAIRSASKEAEILSADDASELKSALSKGVDLVLFNRELTYGFDPDTGVEQIRQLRTEHANVRMMLVSNYPDAQAAAVAAGAMPGFGKRDIGSPRAVKALQDALA